MRPVLPHEVFPEPVFWHTLLPIEDDMPVRPALFRAVFANDEVAHRISIDAQMLQEFLHVRVRKNRRPQVVDAARCAVLAVSEGDHMRGFCGFTFGNVAAYPVIDFSFATLPAFATGNKADISDLHWIETHDFCFLSLNAHWTKGVVLCRRVDYLRNRRAAGITRGSDLSRMIRCCGRGDPAPTLSLWGSLPLRGLSSVPIFAVSVSGADRSPFGEFPMGGVVELPIAAPSELEAE